MPSTVDDLWHHGVEARPEAEISSAGLLIVATNDDRFSFPQQYNTIQRCPECDCATG